MEGVKGGRDHRDIIVCTLRSVGILVSLSPSFDFCLERGGAGVLGA